MAHAVRAQRAFNDALDLVRSQNPDRPIDTWLQDKYSAQDVQDAIQHAQNRYESRPKSKAREWLVKASERVTYYGGVLDMLVQHHPEYVSLAWGTTKLLFVLFQNHDELVTELAKYMSEIADTLPRTQTFLAIYDDPGLQTKATALYALLIEHLHEMLKFYQERPLKHAWKAFIQPYSIRFKKRKDAIDACSRSIDRHVEVAMHRVLQELQDTNRDLQTSVALILEKLSQVQGDTALLPSMSLSQRRLEMADMIAQASNDALQQPIDALQLRLAHSKRHALRLSKQLDRVWGAADLLQWSTQRGSRTLHIHGSWPTRLETSVVGTQMVHYTHAAAGFTVLWALQSPGPSSRAAASTASKMTWTQILKYLTMQALQVNADAVSASLDDRFNLMSVARATDDQQWERNLLRALVGLPLVYIVIDLEVIDDSLLAAENVVTVLASLERLCARGDEGNCKLPVLKIAVIDQRRDRRLPSSSPAAASLNIDRLLRRPQASPRVGARGARGVPGRGRAPFAVRSMPAARSVRS